MRITVTELLIVGGIFQPNFEIMVCSAAVFPSKLHRTVVPVPGEKCIELARESVIFAPLLGQPCPSKANNALCCDPLVRLCPGPTEEACVKECILILLVTAIFS